MVETNFESLDKYVAVSICVHQRYMWSLYNYSPEGKSMYVYISSWTIISYYQNEKGNKKSYFFY